MREGHRGRYGIHPFGYAEREEMYEPPWVGEDQSVGRDDRDIWKGAGSCRSVFHDHLFGIHLDKTFSADSTLVYPNAAAQRCCIFHQGGMEGGFQSRQTLRLEGGIWNIRQLHPTIHSTRPKTHLYRFCWLSF